MDPLSVAASIIAVLQAAACVREGVLRIRDLFDAPDQIDALSNEISSLQITLAELHSVLIDKPLVKTVPQNLLSILKRTEVKVQEIENLLESCFQEPSGSDRDRKLRPVFWVRRKKQITNLRNDLSDLRLELIFGSNISLMYALFDYFYTSIRSYSSSLALCRISILKLES
jgi:hypothetical protein